MGENYVQLLMVINLLMTFNSCEVLSMQDIFILLHGEGTVSTRAPYLTMLNATGSFCGWRCLQSACKGFNVVPKENTTLMECQLMNQLSNASDMRAVVGAQYYQRIDIDDCSSDPCDHNGTCIDAVNSYTCVCAPAYTGTDCQIENLCETTLPCQNGGTCLFNAPTNTYSCLCLPQYTDNNCQTYCAIGSLNGKVETITTPLTKSVFMERAHYSGDWVVLMRRQDGSVDFVTKLWADYKDGFGNLTSEFWLGNEAIHQITNNGSTWTLRIDMMSFAGECRFAEYSSFSLGPESDYYRLHLSGYSGDAGDSLTASSPSHGNHDGRRFQTTDNRDSGSVVTYRGAWWYNTGFYGKLTGHYGNTPSWQGIIWEVWLYDTPLAYADMKIRRN